MDPDSQSFEGGEDLQFPYRFHQPTEVSGSDHLGAQTGHIDTFFEQSSVPEYVGMEYQSAADPRYQPATNRMETHTGNLLGDLTAGAFAPSYNTGPYPIISVLDHDAQYDHGGQNDDFEMEETPYAHEEDIADNDDFQIEGMSYAHEEDIVDNDAETFNATTLMTEADTSQNHHRQMIGPNHISSHEPPWTPLVGSLPDPIDAVRPMYEAYHPAGYPLSSAMPHQHGYSVPEALDTRPGAYYPITTDSATLAQNFHTPVNFHGGQQVSDSSSDSLLPCRRRGYSVGATPSEGRSVEVDSRDTSRSDFLSANGYATSSNGMPPSTPSMLSETPASCPDTMLCPYQGCEHGFTGKYRRGTLQRHMRLKHINGQSNPDQERRYFCYVEGCGKNYMRQDALLKHQRTKHPELGLPPPVTRKQEL